MNKKVNKVPDENTPEGQQAARDAQNNYARSIGNIESIPEAERTEADWRAYLMQIKGRIEDFAPHDAQSCIAPHDSAFFALITQYNAVLARVDPAARGVSESFFAHAPFCVPVPGGGTGPRK